MAYKSDFTNDPTMAPAVLRLWDRRKFEKDDQWKAFCAYLAMNKDGTERTCTRLAKTIGRPVGELRQWYKQFEWERRAAAFDAYSSEVRDRVIDDRVGQQANAIMASMATDKQGFFKELIEVSNMALEQIKAILQRYDPKAGIKEAASLLSAVNRLMDTLGFVAPKRTETVDLNVMYEQLSSRFGREEVDARFKLFREGKRKDTLTIPAKVVDANITAH